MSYILLSFAGLRKQRWGGLKQSACFRPPRGAGPYWGVWVG